MIYFAFVTTIILLKECKSDCDTYFKYYANLRMVGCFDEFMRFSKTCHLIADKNYAIAYCESAKFTIQFKTEVTLKCTGSKVDKLVISVISTCKFPYRQHVNNLDTKLCTLLHNNSRFVDYCPLQSTNKDIFFEIGSKKILSAFSALLCNNGQLLKQNLPKIVNKSRIKGCFDHLKQPNHGKFLNGCGKNVLEGICIYICNFPFKSVQGSKEGKSICLERKIIFEPNCYFRQDLIYLAIVIGVVVLTVVVLFGVVFVLEYLGIFIFRTNIRIFNGRSNGDNGKNRNIGNNRDIGDNVDISNDENSGKNKDAGRNGKINDNGSSGDSANWSEEREDNIKSGKTKFGANKFSF
ncbi:hypothetical protein MHBO_002258 [Bonamia ostreae]|uniref:Uncharacterized protein n=1 Tax=Bonamia ostreae TaxID=126728 RepID=A0ABV2ALP3_9EUKA